VLRRTQYSYTGLPLLFKELEKEKEDFWRRRCPHATLDHFVMPTCEREETFAILLFNDNACSDILPDA
jgi:hypothetical protein